MRRPGPEDARVPPQDEGIGPASIEAATLRPELFGTHAEPDVEQMLEEINGYTVADGTPVPEYTHLKNDGSTAWTVSSRKDLPRLDARRYAETTALLSAG